jgi:hypothetical protein
VYIYERELPTNWAEGEENGGQVYLDDGMMHDDTHTIK